MPVEQQLETALEKHRAGDVAAAAAIYRAILAAQPEQPDALHMLGVIAFQAGNPELGLKLIEASLAKNPTFAVGWYNRCLVLRKLNRPDDALQSAREAVALDPIHADAWDMMASIHREKRQFEDARAAMEKAVKLRPDSVQILSSYAVLLTAMGRLPEAWTTIKKIISHNDVSIFMAAGNILKAAGQPERAVPWFRKALAIKPDFHGASLNEAMALLQMGNTEKGWQLWERRLLDGERPPLPAPQWMGQNVKHLLLREDQGMGDALQCVRYIPLIRGRADKITLQIAPLLRDLLTPNLPGIDIITTGDTTPGADAAAQLMSMPALCKTETSAIPPGAPYIKAEESWRAPWRERLAALPKPRIGLVWGGNPGNRHEYNRSIDFAVLAPVLAAAPGHFVSLQKGPQSDPKQLAVAGVFDAGPYLDNFTSTAGLMAELDLVLTICSSPAHLAGAMGRPTWLMLCFDPHWVWLLGREDSPWYPAIRLFRQKAPGDWASVTSAIADDLKKFLGGDRSVLTPKCWSGAPMRQNPLAIDLPD